MGDACPVRVAIRVRPLVPREQNEGCQQCLNIAPNQPQVSVGSKHTFTYDHVLPPEASQEEVYTQAVKPLIQKIFNGYNATVLAYGQTGSGKTFTMGTGDALTMDDGSDEVSIDVGVIPRVIRDLFDGLSERHQAWDVSVSCSFFELYNEEINDLFAKFRGNSPVINIREIEGEIVLNGLTEEVANTPSDVLGLLLKASEVRSVGSTAMNHQSSRSHACFTVNVAMAKKGDTDGRDKMSAKFHLVDLAGSERAKKTKAEGDRFKEGVNINRGLLALGNVIAALGDEKQRGAHVNYRDSKLTRILQDSLGGNSNTVMIACVSPADSSMEETLNTLRYADRAKNIKNKPVVNMDPLALEIHRLKKENQRLRAQLLKIGVTPDEGGDDGVIGDDSLGLKPPSSSDTLAYAQLREDKEKLDRELQAIRTEYEKSVKLVAHLQDKYFEAEAARESLLAKVEALETTAANLNASIVTACGNISNPGQPPKEGDVAEDGTDTDANPNGSMGTQTSFLGDVQEQLKVFQSQFDAIKTTVQGEPEKQSEDEKIEEDSVEGGVMKLTPVDEQEHLIRQARFGQELSNLDNMLKQKELQLKKMKSGEEEMDNIRQKYEDSVSHLEKEVCKLTKEKKELLKSAKVSEERRKKLQELEAKMAQLRKQSSELNRLKKMKDENDKTVKKMTEDIIGLKTMRVKHIRQMKADAEEFRKWKQASQKEVKQLKEAERKRHCALMKLERQHELQGAVLKRKTEEATAAKRRLDEVLKKRNEIKRQKKVPTATEQPPPESQTAAFNEFCRNKLEPIIVTEIESRFAEAEGKRNLEDLIDGRKGLMERRRKLEAAKSKGLRSQNVEGEDPDSSIVKINGEIELTNCQVQELQQNMLEMEATKERLKFANAAEYRVALKFILQKIVEIKTEEAAVRREKEALSEDLKSANMRMEELKTEMHEKDADYENRLSDMLQQNEEKVLFFLRNPALAPNTNNIPEATSTDLSSSLNADTLKRLQFQEVEINRLQSLADELEKQRRLNKQLMEQLKSTKEVVKLEKEARRQAELIDYSWEEEEEEEDDEEHPEDSIDEDWSPSLGPGASPLIKAWGQTKKSRSFVSVADPKARLIAQELPIEAKKRRTFLSSSEVVKCSCKAANACKGKSCGCRKVGRICGPACNCLVSNCNNRDPALLSESIGATTLAPPKVDISNDSKDDGEESTLNETDCFAAPSRIRRAKKSNKENSTSVLDEENPPAAPTRLSRQRSRPLVTLPEQLINLSTPASSSLDGTFDVNSIEDHPSDPPLDPLSKTKSNEGGSDSGEDDDTLDGEDAVEGTPEAFKLPALKARKAHKYVNQVNKEGGYFSPKYVPVNPGLQADDVM